MCILIIIIHNYYLLALLIFKYSKFRAKHITPADRDASHLGIYDHNIIKFVYSVKNKCQKLIFKKEKTQRLKIALEHLFYN